MQRILDDTCKALSDRNIKVRYGCSDSDSGYSKQYQGFFKKWYLAYLTSGLSAALDVTAGEDMTPVTDCTP
jgi:hypothetical protein